MILMANDISRLRAKRGGHRRIVTKYSKEAVSLLESDTETNVETKIRRFTTIKDSLQNRLAQITELEVCDTTDIEREMEESDVVNARVVEMIDACDCFIKNCPVTVTHGGHPPSSGKDAPSD